MFVYYFVEPYLSGEMFFEKKGEQYQGLSILKLKVETLAANLCWRMKKMLGGACLLFYFFLGDKKE